MPSRSTFSMCVRWALGLTQAKRDAAGPLTRSEIRFNAPRRAPSSSGYPMLGRTSPSANTVCLSENASEVLRALGNAAESSPGGHVEWALAVCVTQSASARIRTLEGSPSDW